MLAKKLKHEVLARKLEIVKVDRDQIAKERDRALQELEGKIDMSEHAKRMIRRIGADREALIDWLVLS
jgi:hypothetical protein